MYKLEAVKNALTATKGTIRYQDSTTFEKLEHFATLCIGNSKFVVTLPKPKPDKVRPTLNNFTGMLWLVDLKDGLPIVTSKHFHFFDYKVANLKTAVDRFNTQYRKNEHEPGEIINIQSFFIPDETPGNRNIQKTFAVV